MSPTRALRPCPHPGCSALVASGRCEAHAPAQGTGWDRWQAKHGSSTARGYGHAWRRIRDAYIKAHPQCEREQCGRPSQEVDHIRPKALGGTDDAQNLRALCSDCHRRRPRLAPSWISGGAA